MKEFVMRLREDAFKPVTSLPNKLDDQYIDYDDLPVEENPVELPEKVLAKIDELAYQIIAGELDKRAADVALMDMCDGVELAAAVEKLNTAITVEADKHRSLPAYSGIPVFVNCGLNKLRRALDRLQD